MASPSNSVFKRLLQPGRVERMLKQLLPEHAFSELIARPRLSGVRNWEPLKQVIVPLLRGMSDGRMLRRVWDRKITLWT